MITKVHKTKNLCGANVGMPIRLTTNRLGRTHSEPLGWKANEAQWLSVPNTSVTYIGPSYDKFEHSAWQKLT